MKCQNLFTGKNKKHIGLLSSELGKKVVKITILVPNFEQVWFTPVNVSKRLLNE